MRRNLQSFQTAEVEVNPNFARQIKSLNEKMRLQPDLVDKQFIYIISIIFCVMNNLLVRPESGISTLGEGDPKVIFI